MRARVALAGLAAALACAPAAPAAELSLSPVLKRTLSASGTTTERCGDSLGGRGVAVQGFAATVDGTVTARTLRGAGDWDLAVFKRERRLGGSQGFGSNEVVTGDVRRGERVVVVGCRRAAAKRSAKLQVVFAQLGAPVAPHRAGRAQMLEVEVPSRMAMQALEELGVDVTHDVHGGHANVISYGARDLDLLRKAGFRFEVLIDDLVAHQRRERAQDRAYAARVGAKGSPLPSNRTSYRTLEDIQGDIKSLVSERPDIVRAVQLEGFESFQGRELQVIEIGKDVNKPNDGKPYFVLNGMHHAREWPAAEMPTEFAIDLVRNYGKDPRVTKLLDTTRVVVMPVTNADGFDHSRSSPISDGLFVGQYRRKTCSFPLPSGMVPCEAQVGVDPNRNYGESWGGPGASSVPAWDTYRGPSPFSEPETQAVQKLVSTFPATTFITVHNIAALVLRPPGLKADGFAPDEPRLKALGDAMGKATGYTSQYGWQLYDTTGTTDDWSYAATGGFGYTIEIGPSGGDFHGDYQTHMVDEYTGTGKYKGKGLREAFFLAAEHARDAQDNSVLSGRAPAGRVLKLTKDFTTKTYSVCTLNTDIANEGCQGPGAVQEIPEHLETSITVPASGKFEWWMNPSTRPFVAKAGKTEAYKLTCSDGDKVITEMELAIARGEVKKLDLPCGGVLPPEEAAPVKKAKKKKAKKPVCKTKKQKRTKACKQAAKKKKQRKPTRR